jgi:hypothetical protein
MRQAYTVYEVIGWRMRSANSALVIHERAADARWFGNAPELYADKRGEEAEKADSAHRRAARSYPYANEYQRLARAELQHLRRLDHARGAGTRRRSAAHRDRQGLHRQRRLRAAPSGAACSFAGRHVRAHRERRGGAGSELC